MAGLRGRQRRAWTVSSSRISPIRITSGSWRRTRRSARLKEAVSMPTSRWLITERLSSCTNSIGSSIVTMCLLVVWFMWSIIAASVVDLPEPVVPVSSTIPRSSSASSVTTAGSASSSIVLILCGIARQAIEITPRWRKALTRKRATSGISKEKSTSCSAANSFSLTWSRSSSRSTRSVSSALSTGSCRPTSSPLTRNSGAAPTFRCRSEPHARLPPPPALAQRQTMTYPASPDSARAGTQRIGTRPRQALERHGRGPVDLRSS